jgi:cellulase
MLSLADTGDTARRSNYVRLRHLTLEISGRDDKFNAKRIAFSYNQKGSPRFGVVNQTSPDIACNSGVKVPELEATARAGSKINFMWSPWFKSHKGPIISYLAAYDGPINKVNLNQLKFFKIGERGLAEDNRTWAVDEMMNNDNITSTVIPHDIKPGAYIVRHELIALHYATEDSLYHMKPEKLLGPQV